MSRTNRKKKPQATKKPPEKADKESENRQVNSIEIKIELIPVDIKTHKDKNGGHYHVIVDNIDEKHVSVGLSTKKKKGKNHPNYPLEKSPLDDGKNSYMRRQGNVESVDSYYSPRKGTMTPKDYNQAKVYGERAKQKYLNGKKDKKK